MQTCSQPSPQRHPTPDHLGRGPSPLAWLLLLLVLLALARPGLASDSEGPLIPIDQQTHKLVIGARMAALEDPDGRMSFDDVKQRPDWEYFLTTTTNVNLGFTRSTWWLSFRLSNTESHTLRRFLEIGYPVLDHLIIHAERDGKRVARYELGDKQPFGNRPVEHRNFVVPMDLPPHSTTHILMQVRTSSSLQVPVTLWEVHTLIERMQTQAILHGLYYGALMVLMLYNLFIYVTVRERKYLYYVFFTGSVIIFIASINGLSFQYLWPEATRWNDTAILVSLALLVVTAGRFSVDFLDIRKNFSRRFNIAQEIPIFGTAALLPLIPFAPYSASLMVVIFLAVIGILLLMFAGLSLWQRNYRPAKFYCVAWFTFLSAGVILALNKFNLLPRNMLTEDALILGSALEGIVLSMALADRFNQEKIRRSEAQQAALEHERIAHMAKVEALEQEKNARIAQENALRHEKEAREAQAQALQIQQRANDTLEQKVRERTVALEAANQKLERLTVTDGLTAIRNRRYFDTAIVDTIAHARAQQSPMALLLVDIDFFKRLNDQFGHLVGDDCLKLVALILQSRVHRDNDVVARYGGEEFAILLPDTDRAGAVHIAERIRADIEQTPFRDGDTAIPLTVSIGLQCIVPDDTTHPNHVIDAADAVLYKAKAEGRNRVCIHPDATDRPVPN